MPQGKGTYGSQVGRPREDDSLLNDDRPRKQKEPDIGNRLSEDGSLLNDDREGYFLGGVKKKILAEHFGFGKANTAFPMETLLPMYPNLEERNTFAEGGEPSILAISVEKEQMLPDEEMEEDYVDYVVSST